MINFNNTIKCDEGLKRRSWKCTISSLDSKADALDFKEKATELLSTAKFELGWKMGPRENSVTRLFLYAVKGFKIVEKAEMVCEQEISVLNSS